MRDKPHRALWNQQRLKRRLEHRFRIVKQLPFHFARRRLKNRTKQVGFYRLFNFHLHPTFEHLNTTSLTLTYMVILTPDYNNQLLWAREYNSSNAYIDMVILTSDDNMTAFPPPPAHKHTWFMVLPTDEYTFLPTDEYTYMGPPTCPLEIPNS